MIFQIDSLGNILIVKLSKSTVKLDTNPNLDSSIESLRHLSYGSTNHIEAPLYSEMLGMSNRTKLIASDEVSPKHKSPAFIKSIELVDRSLKEHLLADKNAAREDSEATKDSSARQSFDQSLLSQFVNLL